MRYWRTQLADLCLLIVVPAIAALLPWRLGWRWLRYWAGISRGSFSVAVNSGKSIAREWLPIGDDALFDARMRLLWLTDCSDLYVSMLRPWRAGQPRHIEQKGQWPTGSGFIAMGFHYGAGYPVLRSLAAANFEYTFVSGRWRREDDPGHPVRYWYGRLRTRDVARVGRRPIAYRPGIKPQLDQTLREGAVVVGLIDLPPRLAPRQRHPVSLLGHELSLPGGLIELAREAGVPIVPYWVEFDDPMYRRRICIGDPIPSDDIGAAVIRLSDILDRCIRSAPYAWMLWPELPGWIAADNGDKADDVRDEREATDTLPPA